MFLLCTGQALAEQVSIIGALLPSSRGVQLGGTATAFATLVNSTRTTATGCGLSLGTNIDADFDYRATDPLTNQVIEPAETLVDIPAGGSQSWIFSVTPRTELPPTEIVISMSCGDTTGAAPVYPGVNTLLLSASTEPRPDIIGLVASLANDGVVRAPGYVGTGVFSVATSNVGAAGVVTAVPTLLGNHQGSRAMICQTNEGGGCIAAPTPSVQFVADAGASNSFGVFIEANGVPVDFDPANTRVQVVFLDGTGIQRGATSVAYETQTALGNNGGTLHYDGTAIRLQTNDAWAPVSVVPTNQAGPPAALPAGFGTTERTRRLWVSDETRLNAPLEMIFDYDESRIGSDAPTVLRYDQASSRYLPLSVLGIDADNNRIRVEARDFSDFDFSDFVTTAYPDIRMPSSFEVSGFDINRDVWNIANFGSYFTPGGNSLGMSAYAVWFASHRAGESLLNKFSAVGGPPNSQAHFTAIRAQLAQHQPWGNWQYRNLDELPAGYVGNQLELALYLTNEPQVLLLGIDGQAQHAVVVYGWTRLGFLIYEVGSAPGTERSELAAYNRYRGSFGPYGSFNSFGFLTSTSLGRSWDFGQLTRSAEAGFPRSSIIFVELPTQGQIFDDRQAPLLGGLTDALTDGAKVVSYLNGEKSKIADHVVTFESVLPIKAAENTLILVAGEDAEGSMWFPGSPVLARTFVNIRATSTLRSTLTWTKEGDVDLYVIEPAGEVAWWANLATSNGLELDFDNVVAYGPENITLSLGEGDTLLPGDYRVRVHYYRGDGPVSGSVQIVTYEGQSRQLNRTFNWTIPAHGDSVNSGPDGAGAQWFEIANIDLLNNLIR